jgi:hypothetical protein
MLRIIKYAFGNLSAALRSILRKTDADLVYTLLYSMSVYRPFPAQGVSSAPALGGGDRALEIGPEDSDGIVNTRSMLFHDPRDPSSGDHERALIDHCDHADIIGHYRLQPRSGPGGLGRQHTRYDFFRSGSGFDPDRFSAIWNDVFAFCCPPD